MSTIKVAKSYRDIDAEIEVRAADAEGAASLYSLAFSSETPVERFDWMTGTRYLEVLGHEPNEVDLKRLRNGGAFLVNHNSDDQVGVVESAEVADGKGRAEVRFSRNARGQEIETDVRDKIRRLVSVGYFPLRFKVTGKDEKSGLEVRRVTRWLPVEVSTVPIPADASVGFGRALPNERDLYEVEIEDGDPVVEVRGMGEELKGATPTSGGAPSGGAATAVIDRTAIEAEVAASRTAERARVAELTKLARSHKQDAKLDAWIDSGKSVSDVRAEILAAIETRGAVGAPAAESGGGAPGIVGLKPHRYSLARAIKSQIKGLAQREDVGFEVEVGQELARTTPNRFGGIIVPTSKRVMDSLTAGKGTETVFETQGEMIEMLKAATVSAALGASFKTDLVGPVAFPKKTGALTANWMAENPAAAATTSDLAFGQVLLAPKTLIVTTQFSRQLMHQSAISIEDEVKKDITEQHALAIDTAVIHGTGSGAQPTGIYNAVDVQSQAMGGVPTYALLVGMVGLVLDKNVVNGASLGYVTTPLMASVLMRTLEASAAGASWVWTGTVDNGRIAGYKAVASSIVSKVMSGSAATGGSEHGMVFGNWSDCLIGLWGSQEIVVDEITLATSALIKVTSYQATDIGFRHGELFVKSTGGTIA